MVAEASRKGTANHVSTPAYAGAWEARSTNDSMFFLRSTKGNCRAWNDQASLLVSARCCVDRSCWSFGRLVFVHGTQRLAVRVGESCCLLVAVPGAGGRLAVVLACESALIIRDELGRSLRAAGRRKQAHECIVGENRGGSGKAVSGLARTLVHRGEKGYALRDFRACLASCFGIRNSRCCQPASGSRRSTGVLERIEGSRCSDYRRLYTRDRKRRLQGSRPVHLVSHARLFLVADKPRRSHRPRLQRLHRGDPD